MRFLLLYLAYCFAVFVGLAFAGLRRRGPAAPSAGRKSRPRVLIFGATGGTGEELVKQGLARGHRITVLVRNPARLSMSHPNLTVIRGNALDRVAVDAAMKDQDAVISVLGHHGYYSPAWSQTRATESIVAAMESGGVSRFVCQTTLGLGDSAGKLGLVYTLFVIPAILALYFADKAGQERAIAASRLEWIIVRPGALVDGPARGRFRHGTVGSYLGMPRIARADVASFLLDQIETDDYVRRTPGVCW